MKDTKVAAVRMSGSDHALLKQIAEAQKCPLADVIREILHEGLWRRMNPGEIVTLGRIETEKRLRLAQELQGPRPGVRDR